MSALIDVRAQVVNDLNAGIREFVLAADELEAAAKTEDKARVRRAGRRLFVARDNYLAPLVERAERGEDW